MNRKPPTEQSVEILISAINVINHHYTFQIISLLVSKDWTVSRRQDITHFLHVLNDIFKSLLMYFKQNDSILVNSEIGAQLHDM